MFLNSKKKEPVVDIQFADACWGDCTGQCSGGCTGVCSFSCAYWCVDSAQ